MLGQGEYVVECMSWENYMHIKCPVNSVGSRAAWVVVIGVLKVNILHR